ncbi:DUF6042 family protein [Clavibacter michiganensis]|uniref:DUF6042 family protein n=1 Tax=Clavibacter michiganensis TaxID=28447 RepID=UPI00292DC966|nr:DUF6042 family protein [Clavibacter michiganensis]
MTVYMHDGWSRVLPLYAQAPVHAIAALDGATREELDVEIARHFETTAGLASTAWEPLRQWTDEELQELDSEFGVPEGEPRTAADVMKWEAEARDKHLVAMERYARHLGVPKVQTIGDLLDFMVTAGVLLLDNGIYTINPNAPLPAEALPLSAGDAASEDAHRWRRLHERIATRIISLFHPRSLARADELTANLIQIARETDAEPESVRAAVGLLLEEGDFSVSPDIERVQPEEDFTLRVDWAAFDRTRIHVRLAMPDEQED